MEGNGMSNATVNQAIINCVYVNRTEKTAILKILVDFSFGFMGLSQKQYNSPVIIAIDHFNNAVF